MADKIPLVIANWKMKLGLAESVSLIRELKPKFNGGAELVVCPSFTALTEAAQALKGGKIKLGAQDCFWEAAGSYTGEVSANQLKETGCRYVIIGHSERRKNLNETDEMVHNKVKAALAAGLVPVVCVGETFEQRQEGAKDFVIIDQLTKALEGLEVKSGQHLVVAYEPVWVIGTGQAVTPADAGEAHDVLRQALTDLFDPELAAEDFRIIYGGSVDQHNVHSFTALNNIDGVLVGMASLKAGDLLPLIKNV
jgi:triosephosphate isomerase